MTSSVRWSLAALGLALSAFVCTVKAGKELEKEKDEELWRQTVLDINGSSSSPSSPPQPESPPINSE